MVATLSVTLIFATCSGLLALTEKRRKRKGISLARAWSIPQGMPIVSPPSRRIASSLDCCCLLSHFVIRGSMHRRATSGGVVVLSCASWPLTPLLLECWGTAAELPSESGSQVHPWTLSPARGHDGLFSPVVQLLVRPLYCCLFAALRFGSRVPPVRVLCEKLRATVVDLSDAVRRRSSFCVTDAEAIVGESAEELEQVGLLEEMPTDSICETSIRSAKLPKAQPFLAWVKWRGQLSAM